MEKREEIQKLSGGTSGNMKSLQLLLVTNCFLTYSYEGRNPPGSAPKRERSLKSLPWHLWHHYHPQRCLTFCSWGTNMYHGIGHMVGVPHLGYPTLSGSPYPLPPTHRHQTCGPVQTCSLDALLPTGTDI